MALKNTEPITQYYKEDMKINYHMCADFMYGLVSSIVSDILLSE